MEQKSILLHNEHVSCKSTCLCQYMSNTVHTQLGVGGDFVSPLLYRGAEDTEVHEDLLGSSHG